MKESAADAVEDVYKTSEEKAGDALKSARARVRDGVRQAEDLVEGAADYVSRNPLSSVFLAAGAGIACGIGFARIFSRDRSHPLLDRVREGVEAGERSWNQIRGGWSQVMAGLKAAAAQRGG